MNTIKNFLTSNRQGAMTTTELVVIIAITLAGIIAIFTLLIMPALEGQATKIADIITNAGSK